MRTLPILLPLASIAVLVSCSTMETAPDAPKNKDEQTKGFLSQLAEGEQGFSNPDGFIPPDLMNGGNRGKAQTMEANAEKDLLSMGKNDNIIFTDPDNPYADIKELDEAFTAQNERTKQWQQSFAKALRDARRTGKPVLIWFHDSKFSPASSRLSNELFKTDMFEDWAKEHLIRLCYDKSSEYENTGDNQQQGILGDLTTKRKEYVRKAFDHYNVRGTPNVIILSPDGRQVASWKGYSGGNSQTVMQRIRQDTDLANKQFDEFKQRLRSTGYRDWTGKSSIKIFAKFVRFDKKKNTVWLKEFDGTQFSTSLDMLDDKDRDYAKTIK